ncbi:hypothetical protein MBESOW_P0084 [Sphingobium xenophagum]|uniref:Uncharacterized protein n=1 Tax=Sphingobium xenophagum TaxID=121428 RepID=A0A401IWP3_SPHXE|nr:hypothetical protein MBESOW_P0084 [Sphingobium xenophagum]
MNEGQFPAASLVEVGGRFVGASRLWHMPRHPGGQKMYQLRIHESVVIGDVQADDALPRSEVRNFRCSFALCCFSITTIMSAHLTSSLVSGFSASLFVPAEATSMPG